nr:DNA replication protein [Serratia marcescens]
MGSCAAPSAKGDDKFITTDYLQQWRRPARWADSHIDMYVACVIRGLCSSAGRWSYGVVSPVTGRVRPLTRSTAPRPEGGPPFPRAGARRPLRTPVGDIRQLCGGERD